MRSGIADVALLAMAHVAQTIASAVVLIVQVGWLVRGYCRFINKHQAPKAKMTTLFSGEK